MKIPDIDINQMRMELHADKSFNKVFGIGFNKTGSTSLEAILSTLGFRMPNQQEQEVLLVKQLHKGNFQPFLNFVKNYDAFQDMPFSQGYCYIQADALFPSSKFILTVRDPEEWYESMSRFYGKIWGIPNTNFLSEAFFKDKNLYLYKNYMYDIHRKIVLDVNDEYKINPNWDNVMNKETYISHYKRRNAEIIKYFDQRPEDLLVIDITKEKTISKILSFFGLSQEYDFPMPQLNKT